jgi:hypothetical protein
MLKGTVAAPDCNEVQLSQWLRLFKLKTSMWMLLPIVTQGRAQVPAYQVN